ncbi:MAG: hypothetical protein Q4A78_05940 [Peptostreptococcaceae bacterium]|nr:hypothetical protein [Peptostreptococcaceae bacterium]
MNAYCLVLVINDISKYDRIMKRLFDMGLGATSIDSEGMGKFLVQKDVRIPFFATITQMVEGNRPYNKTVLCMIREREKLTEAVQMIEEELNIHGKAGMGFMFVLPVLEYYGFDGNNI